MIVALPWFNHLWSLKSRPSVVLLFCSISPSIILNSFSPSQLREVLLLVPACSSFIPMPFLVYCAFLSPLCHFISFIQVCWKLDSFWKYTFSQGNSVSPYCLVSTFLELATFQTYLYLHINLHGILYFFENVL